MKFPLDARISERAEVIVCTSPKYPPFYQKPGKKVLHIPHGVAEEEFQLDEELVDSYYQKWGDYILLVGTFYDGVALDLLEKISHLGPKLILIGNSKYEHAPPDHLWHKILESPNVEWLGPVHAQVLKNYIAGASICLNAYKFDRNNIAGGSGSPMKMLNYLAQFKPIITSIDSEIPTIDGKGIYRAYNENDFIQLVHKGIAGELAVDKMAVQEYLDSHAYPSMIEEVLQSLTEHKNLILHES